METTYYAAEILGDDGMRKGGVYQSCSSRNATASPMMLNSKILFFPASPDGRRTKEGKVALPSVDDRVGMGRRGGFHI